jgi:tetrahydromethanopterin S-methyltransferase subunit E
LLVFALSLLAAVSGEPGVNFEYVTIATAVVNVLLRFVTSDPIGWFKE